MTFDQRKVLVLAAWVATISTVGFIATIDVPAMWILVASLAIIPAAVGNWLWNAPVVSLSQLIHRSRS